MAKATGERKFDLVAVKQTKECQSYNNLISSLSDEVNIPGVFFDGLFG